MMSLSLVVFAIMIALVVLLAWYWWMSILTAQKHREQLAQGLLGNPEVKTWLDNHLTNQHIHDLKNIRQTFHLTLAEAKE